MKDLIVEKVICRPEKGVLLDHAIREAIILAVTEMRTVQFFFNDTSVVIDPQSLLCRYSAEWHAKRPGAPQ